MEWESSGCVRRTSIGKSSQHQLIAQAGALEGCSIHCSVECKPWSQWQHLNRAKYPKLTARFRQERAESAALAAQFIRVADICLDNGGDCSFEWPRYCTGWALPSIQAWILERNLHSATFNGCTVGVEADGQPAKKPWRFITSSLHLATSFAALKCTHSSHAPLQGKWTRMSAFNHCAIWWSVLCFPMLPTDTFSACRVLLAHDSRVVSSLWRVILQCL